VKEQVVVAVVVAVAAGSPVEVKKSNN